MSAKTPTVQVGHSGGHVLAWLDEPTGADGHLRLDTPAWLAWLEAPTTTSFSYPVFDPRVGYIVRFMTVRKEQRQRGGSYWSVYCRAGRRLQRIYLGKSVQVTLARLEALAQELRGNLQQP